MFSQIYGGSVHFYIASHRPVLSELLCPEGEKAWRTTFRRFVPFRGEVFQLVKPTSQAIHHLPNYSMESMEDYAYYTQKEVPIRVYRFTTDPGVNSTCCSFSKKEAHGFF